MKIREEILRKYLFAKNLETALLIDQQNNHVDSIEYIYDKQNEDEIIIIFFRNGPDKKILATGNSNGQNATEIIKAVYGGEYE